MRFGLWCLKEHNDLRRYPDSQINLVKIDGKEALVYHKFTSKTTQGSISDHGKVSPRVSYFCNGHRVRCFIELNCKYLFLGLPGSHSWPKLYVQTYSKWQPGSDYWYTNRPVRKNTLAKYIQTMMSDTDIEGYFRNHSIRKSTCTKLSRKGLTLN